MSMALERLKAADLVPGRLYVSPSGRMCVLLKPGESGIGNAVYLFSYVNGHGRASMENGFSLAAENATAIAAMREVTRREVQRPKAVK